MNLDFEITEFPKWREDKSKYSPGVKIMLKDIVDYIKKWEDFKKQKEPIELRQKLREIRVRYIVHTQIEEDIGVKSSKETAHIIDEIDEKMEELSIKRKSSGESDDITVKRHKSEDENSNVLDSNILDENCVENKKNIDFTESSINGVFHSRTSQEMLLECLEDKQVSDIKKQETVNLYSGLVYLEQLIVKEDCSTNEEKADLDKMIDVSDCIRRPHEILTRNVLSVGMIPGQFSTCKRCGEFNTQIYYYPHFETEKIAEAAVYSVVDEYHKHLADIKKEIQKATTLQVLEKIFKVATSFLFSFLQIHPFPDGNGRLGRLLCSHVLGLFSPFPTAIYNAFSTTRHKDYVQALVNARTEMDDIDIQEQIKNELVATENKAISIAYKYLAASPSDLCALIIESNWCTWRELMNIDRQTASTCKVMNKRCIRDT